MAQQGQWIAQLMTQNLQQGARVQAAQEPPVPAKAQLQVPEYNGDQCYSAWHEQFLTCTEGCTEEERGSKLVAALRGKAANVLTMLRQQQKPKTYQELNGILSKTFNKETSFWQRKRDFETLQQKETQSVQDFALELEHVGRQYMVTHDERDIQEVLVTAFVRGLRDRSAAQQLAFSHCDTLADAMRNLNRGLLLSGEPPAKRTRTVVIEEVDAEELEEAYVEDHEEDEEADDY